MLIGSGANGKSVLMSVLISLLGKNNVTAVQPDQFESRFQRAHFHGKLANVITEIKEGGEIADAQLKSLVSGEMTTAEHKFKEPFEFIPFATHWFGTNHMPHTRDFSDALFRRAIILTFNNKFEGKNCDVHFKQNLQLTRNIRPRKKDRTRTLAVIVGAFFEELEAFIQTKLGETVRFGEQRKSREILLQIIEAKGLFALPKKLQQAETEFCETQEESFEDDN
jgi:hypothetical protein